MCVKEKSERCQSIQRTADPPASEFRNSETRVAKHCGQVAGRQLSTEATKMNKDYKKVIRSWKM
ncbi:MAG: hypothetical protein DRG66_07705, partial [Deltaproteobacteria bacterium]